ncbi:hypothetical protein BaRGS_00010717 [Batillaria attramentaria]|uniref:Uncharacterized protein n=1 Tax=Batillaria attramentaria TaxID=370345 RepID=A0ABD0LGP1_9CAEN
MRLTYRYSTELSQANHNDDIYPVILMKESESWCRRHGKTQTPDQLSAESCFRCYCRPRMQDTETDCRPRLSAVFITIRDRAPLTGAETRRADWLLEQGRPN